MGLLYCQTHLCLKLADEILIFCSCVWLPFFQSRRQNHFFTYLKTSRGCHIVRVGNDSYFRNLSQDYWHLKDFFKVFVFLLQTAESWDFVVSPHVIFLYPLSLLVCPHFDHHKSTFSIFHSLTLLTFCPASLCPFLSVSSIYLLLSSIQRCVLCKSKSELDRTGEIYFTYRRYSRKEMKWKAQAWSPSQHYYMLSPSLFYLP